MNIYFAENLKLLRKQAGITQERLADVLGVSPQAVSRWESENTYPDITMLPTIASFFHVTLDALMGMEKIRDESDLENIFEEYRKNGSKGLVAENIRLLREALKRYPNNYELLRRLVKELHWAQVSDEEHSRNLKEVMELSEQILQECTDREIKSDVSVTLCYVYQEMGETEKAIKLAETLPSIWETRNTLLQRLYSGEKQIEYCQQNVLAGAELMYWAIYELADLNYKRDDLSTTDRIKIMQKCLCLYELIYDEEDYLFQSERLSKLHRYIASMEMLEGNYDSALSHLEASAAHAIRSDTLPDVAVHTSLLVNRLKYDAMKTTKNYTATECSALCEAMQTERYAAVSDDERFIEILENIRSYT